MVDYFALWNAEGYPLHIDYMESVFMGIRAHACNRYCIGI